MSVAKPTMLGSSPSMLTSHWLEGLPGRQFSATMAFAGEAQFWAQAREPSVNQGAAARVSNTQILWHCLPFLVPKAGLLQSLVPICPRLWAHGRLQ